MTNAEKLAKEMLENLDDFAEILFGGICNLHSCNDCPLRSVYICGDTKKIKKWLKEKKKDD